VLNLNAFLMRSDRLLAIAFVLMVTVALAGLSAGETGASFTGASTNPTNNAVTMTVQPPAGQNAAVSAAAGVVQLSWSATPTAPGAGHTLTYLVLRGPVGGPYVLIGTTNSLAYSNTPPSDGTYEFVIDAQVAGGGTFVSGNSAAQTGKSDRVAPTMSITCNAGSCGGWFNATVSVTASGVDGGTGMGSVTRNVDAAGQVSTGGSSATFNVSGENAGHTVAYFGTDAAGNASSTANQTVKIDLTAPTTPGAFAAVNGTCCTAPFDMKFTWTAASDALSGVASQTLHYVEIAAATACPAAATPANFPSTVALGAAATTTTVTGSALGRKICGYIESTDSAGNVSAPSAIKSGFAV
jgi:hypothetical protein